MIYSAENERYLIEVNDMGAELWNIIDKKESNLPRLWQGDPKVWARRAPIVFPYCGRLKDDFFYDRGRKYEGPIHGFARFEQHTICRTTETEIGLELLWNEQTLLKYPWKFRLATDFILQEKLILCRFTLENLDTRDMPFNIGYHMGFTCPFDEAHDISDYQLSFEYAESAVCHTAGSSGLRTGATAVFFPGEKIIPLDHEFFPASFCLSGLKSRYIQLEERSSGRYLRVYIEGFPYVVLWSQPEKIHYVCIEPWHGFPDRYDSNQILSEKEGIQLLLPRSSFSCTQVIECGVFKEG
jgi:galactose mutarotase-like enzyme